MKPSIRFAPHRPLKVLAKPALFAAYSLAAAMSLPITQAQAQAQAVASEPVPTASQANGATSDNTAATVSQVEVKAVRDPAMMPYKKTYEMLTGIKKLGLDDVNMSIRVLAAKSDAVIPDLQIFLDGPSQRQRISISETGEITIPLDAQAYAEGADFIANQKQGSIKVDLRLTPRLPESAISYSALRHSTDSARKTLREIVPWYYRMFMSGLSGVAFCYDTPGHKVLLKTQTSEGAEPASHKSVVADFKLSDMQKRSWFCARFSDDEKMQAVIEPEPGWKALYY